jgi:hypothetical protein
MSELEPDAAADNPVRVITTAPVIPFTDCTGALDSATRSQMVPLKIT